MPAVLAKNHPAHMEITWRDSESEAIGFVVIDRLVQGVSSGGLRMRKGCTLEEVQGLADAMTKKEALHLKTGMKYIPVGGAKGGIDFDPAHPDANKVLERFLIDLMPIIKTHWAMGEDFGVRQDVIDEIFARLELGSSVDAVDPLITDPEAAQKRKQIGFNTKSRGVSQDELVGGLGVAQTTITTRETFQKNLADTRIVVQGFGSMGGATGLFLAEAGAKIVAIVDAAGIVYDENGLDVATLFKNRDRAGTMDRTKLPTGAAELPGDRWLEIDCDVLIPAALSSVITPANQAKINAEFIVEAANLPVTPEAEDALTGRGVTVIPDFLANSGTNAWWWWLVFGDVDGSWESSEMMVRKRLTELTKQVLEIATSKNITPRQAATEISVANLEKLQKLAGSR